MTVGQMRKAEEVGHLRCAHDCALDSIQSACVIACTSTASFPCQYGLVNEPT